jgi:PTH1 family peptidyl-tRNA hydrolase
MIVGLGNPGPEYRGTRHNVGFEVIDLLASRNGIKLDRGRNRALVGNTTLAELPVLLVKPMTYMNLSGQAVAPLARANSLKPPRVLIVADDIDLVLGKLKLKLKGSAGGHNGHKSIAASLQSQEYPRLKIGVGDADRTEVIDHVLSRFTPQERAVIDDAIEDCVRACEVLLRQGPEAAQNLLANHNRHIKGPADEEGD